MIKEVMIVAGLVLGGCGGADFSSSQAASNGGDIGVGDAGSWIDAGDPNTAATRDPNNPWAANYQAILDYVGPARTALDVQLQSDPTLSLWVPANAPPSDAHPCSPKATCNAYPPVPVLSPEQAEGVSCSVSLTAIKASVRSARFDITLSSHNLPAVDPLPPIQGSTPQHGDLLVTFIDNTTNVTYSNNYWIYMNHTALIKLGAIVSSFNSPSGIVIPDGEPLGGNFTFSGCATEVQ